MNLKQIKLIRNIKIEDFENFIYVLQTISQKKPIITTRVIFNHYGIFFTKKNTRSFNDCLLQKSHQLKLLNRFQSKNIHHDLKNFLLFLKTLPDSRQLRQELEAVLLALIKQQRFLDATQMIEMYAQIHFNRHSPSNLWTTKLLYETLNHLKFFNVNANQESLECLFNTLPIHLFQSTYKQLFQFQLHPNKNVFIRALAHIHRGDTGFLEKDLHLDQRSDEPVLKKMFFRLFFFISKPMPTDFIIALTDQIPASKLHLLAHKLTMHIDHPSAYTWLIHHLDRFDNSTQTKLLTQFKDLKIKAIAHELIKTLLAQTDFIQRPAQQKELCYEACLSNSSSLFLEFVQKNRLDKGFLFKVKYLHDFKCLEKTLKKNQYFSNSHCIKKIQKTSRSLIKAFLHKLIFKKSGQHS